MQKAVLRVRAGDPELSNVLALLRRKYAVLRRVCRTPLGEQVVKHYRQELEGGGRTSSKGAE